MRGTIEMDRYINLSPATVALLRELKGLRAFDRITKANQLVVSQFHYNQLDRQRAVGQSFDDLIRRMITTERSKSENENPST